MQRHNLNRSREGGSVRARQTWWPHTRTDVSPFTTTRSAVALLLVVSVIIIFAIATASGSLPFPETLDSINSINSISSINSINSTVWKRWTTQNKDGCASDTTSYGFRHTNKEHETVPYGLYSYENNKSTLATVQALLPRKNDKAGTIILIWPVLNDLKSLETEEKENCLPTKIGDCVGEWSCPHIKQLEQPCYMTESVHFAGAASITLISTDFIGTILPKRATGDLWGSANSEDTYTYPHLRSKVLHDAMNVTVSNMRDLADFWDLYRFMLWDQAPTFESYFQPPKYTFHQKHTKNVASVIISNGNANSYRKEILKELMKHLSIASMGGLYNNFKFPEGDQEKSGMNQMEKSKHKLEIIAKYKFTFAMHNTIEYDTADEKVWGPWFVGSVPIVLGPPNIEDYAPGDKSYISISDYKTPKEFVKHITYLSNNESAYNEYLAWKSKPPRPSFLKLFAYTREWPCLFCQYHQSVVKGQQKELLQQEKKAFSTINNSGMKTGDAVGVVDDFRKVTGTNKCPRKD